MFLKLIEIRETAFKAAQAVHVSSLRREASDDVRSSRMWKSNIFRKPAS